MSAPKPMKSPRPDVFVPDAEAALLVDLLNGGAEDIAECGPLALHPEWFSMSYRPLAEATFSRLNRGDPADPILIVDDIESNDDVDLSAADVRALLHRGEDAIQSPAHAKAYAQQIIDAARERMQCRQAERIVANIYNPQEVLRLLQEQERELAVFGSLDPQEAAHRFHLLKASEAEALKPSRGILGNILYEESIAFLYARSGRWKSFLALAMAYAIASGGTLFGRRARQGSVVYIAAEGARNIGKRITALRRHHGDREAPPLYVLGRSVNLLDALSVQTLIRDIADQLDEAPTAVFIDTLARSMPGGDENAAKDINTVYDALGQIKAAFGCCVFVVHHDGKDSSRGARGSSAIYDNADTVLKITGGNPGEVVHPGDVLTLECGKPKDDDQFDPIPFTTTPDRWASVDNEFVTSLVVIPTQAETQPVTLNDKQTLLLALLVDAEDGLSSSDWLEQSELKKSTFYYNVHVLEQHHLCRLDEEKNVYISAPLSKRHLDRNAAQLSKRGEPEYSEPVQLSKSGQNNVQVQLSKSVQPPIGGVGRLGQGQLSDGGTDMTRFPPSA